MEIIMSQHVLNDFNQSSSTASSSVQSAPSTVPLIPSLADFNILASTLQDIAQVLLKYEMPEPNANAVANTNAVAEKYSQSAQSEKIERVEPPEALEPLGTSESNQRNQSEPPKLLEVLEPPEALEVLEQPAESYSKEQVITFCYDTEGKKTPALHKIHIETMDQYERGEFHEEIRCFHLSESSVRKERAFLKKHNCVHLVEFLEQTHDELSMIVNLLGFIDRDIDLPVKVLQRASYNMSLLLENLEELHMYMEYSQLVHKELVHTAVIST